MSDRPDIETPATKDQSIESVRVARSYNVESASQSLSSPAPADSLRRQHSSHQFELPPLPASASASASRHGSFPAETSRPSSFSAILNPSQPDEQPHGRRRKGPELSSPQLSRPQLPSLTSETQPRLVRSPSLSTSVHSVLSPNVTRQSRRILTPRSPSLHRAVSLGNFGAPQGSLDAQLSPFPPSPRTRTYTAEPGRAGVPSLPTSLSHTRSSYAHSPVDARSTAGYEQLRPGDERPRSTSLSPKSSYATQLSPAHPSVRVDADTSQHRAPQSGHSFHLPESDQSESYHVSDRRTSGIPITSSAGQNAFQMMTLQTTAGTVHLPVEVQAASRVADEKRRRNAGASARFRARRKEKEKESSVTIAKLEMQVKELSEDVDFYRRERGYLAGIVLQVPGGERHFPRPQSPRHRRSSTSLHGMMTSRSTSAGYLSDQNAPPSPGEGRNVRRRTSTLSIAQADAPITASHMPPGMAGPSSYAHASYDIAPLQQPSSSTMPHPHARPLLPGPAALLAPTHTQSQLQSHFVQAPQQHPPWPAYESNQPSAGPSDRSDYQRPR